MHKKRTGIHNRIKSFPSRRLEGTVATTARGIGFFTPEGAAERIRIESGFLNTALHGDRVRVLLHPKRQGQEPSGEVEEVLARTRTEYVGTVKRDNALCFVIPQEPRIYVDFIAIGPAAEEVEEGMKVLVRILPWNNPHTEPRCEILERIGKAGTHDVEMRSIVIEKGFRPSFPQAALREANAIKERVGETFEDDVAVRKDLRGIPTFTIDPDDAKDFDDALSFTEKREGTVEIGVHIADVSHYVGEGTALDALAAERGTSIYLVDRTIPMLPEVLSNDLCSLNPDEDKLAFSVIWTFPKSVSEQSTKVHPLNIWFGKTVIRSQKRFTYKTAQERIEGPGPFHAELSSLHRIAKKLRARKHAEGAILFDHDEIKFELDAQGNVLRAYRKKMLESNSLVEEFMLYANRSVAEEVEWRTRKEGRVFVYRVHDKPDREKARDLLQFLDTLGYRVRVRDGHISSHDINDILRRVEGSPEAHMVQTATIRSLAKAVYSTKNIGHFGLAFKHYTHFTSPIRRYPDIMVHRLFFKYLQGVPVHSSELKKYTSLSAYASQMESYAQDAERSSVKYAQARYMSGHVGAIFKGIISGVAEWGIYVEETATGAEGLIRLADLPDDYYLYNKKALSIVGKRTRRRYRLGDPVTIRVKGVNLVQNLIEYELMP